MKLFIVMVISYLLGNFQTSYLLGKLFMKSDIRELGSGNAGTTNALRVYGVKAAIATLVLDAFKGFLAVFIGGYILKNLGIHVQSIGIYLAGLSVVIGHNWPVFLKFKGGKGIATTIGVAITISPISAVISMIIGILIIAKTKYVSLGTMSGIVIWPLVSLILMSAKIEEIEYNFLIFTMILAVIAIYKHKANIKRLLKGQELKLGNKQ